MSRVENRGLDHLVIAVRDLDIAQHAYKSLGFTTTPIAHHPWGTSNFLVQMDRFFLEVLSVTDESKLYPAAPGFFSFGGYLRDYLKNGQGLAMTVFESFDAARDRDEFAEKQLGDFDRFDFEREAVLPDGSRATVGFSLAFAVHPDLPKAVFFTCQQHAPQYFWKPDYQKHENGALGVGAVAMVCQNPHSVLPFMEALQGRDNIMDGSEKSLLHVGTDRGWINVHSMESARAWYGDAPGIASDGSLKFFGSRIVVADLATAESVLKANGVPYSWQKAGLVVDPGYLLDMVLAFVQAPETV